MNLSADQIKRLHDLGKALTPIKDAAIFLEVDEDELRDELREKNSPLRHAYESGRALTELELRTTEINMAANGSPLAIQHVKGYIDNLILND